jgi:hypothetical protein
MKALVKSDRSFEGRNCKEARLKAKKERAERETRDVSTSKFKTETVFYMSKL